MELGLATFADLPAGMSPQQRMRDLLEEAKLADELGLDVFAIGEHHRPDYLISSPPVALGAVAAITEKIRLSSAVTVLSSEDPVRVFQQFAEIDLISGGRAEIMAGRGSFTESFPLFGKSLDDYDDLYLENLELLLALRDGNPSPGRGSSAPPLENAAIYPRPVQDPLPVWVAVGGSPQSVVRAALARPAADDRDHRRPARALRAAGRALPRGVGGRRPRPRRRADRDQHPRLRRRRRARGRPALRARLPGVDEPHRPRARLAAVRPARSSRRCARPQGALHAGSPEQVAEKILFGHELFGNQRYLGHISLGVGRPRRRPALMERFGTEVAPIVRAEVARREASAAAAPAA